MEVSLLKNHSVGSINYSQLIYTRSLRDTVTAIGSIKVFSLLDTDVHTARPDCPNQRWQIYDGVVLASWYEGNVPPG